MPENNVQPIPFLRSSDYHRLMQVRAIGDAEKNEMILEGRAVVFDEATILFTWNGVDYKEIIRKGAFDATDYTNCFFKYNHSDQVMPMARFKNGSLTFEIRSDGLYFRATLVDTQSARDLYKLVQEGIIDKMSFSFTIQEESYDVIEHTWTVLKIDRLFDVAAVNIPAYDSTSLYARRFDDVEARRKEVEASELEKAKRSALFWIQLGKQNQ